MHQLLDNQHLIENHQHLIIIKHNRLQLIRSTIQISNLSKIFKLIFVSLMGIRKSKQKERECDMTTL